MKCPQCGNEFLRRMEDGVLFRDDEHTGAKAKYLWRYGCPVCHWFSEEWNGYRMTDGQGTRSVEVPAPFWENVGGKQVKERRLISLQLSEQDDGNWTVYASVQDNYESDDEDAPYSTSSYSRTSGTSLSMAIRRAITYLTMFESLAPIATRMPESDHE